MAGFAGVMIPEPDLAPCSLGLPPYGLTAACAIAAVSQGVLEGALWELQMAPSSSATISTIPADRR